jgi:protein-S-isoprenylcysteine O-methyltransferase Ste14
MYVGVMVLELGISVSSGSIVKYAILGGLVVLFYFKSRYEESLLQAKYPNYAEYMKNTPRFWPRFRKG